MRTLVLVVSVIGVLLGGLWLLQGLGVVQIRPILCVAACDEVQKPSATWAVVGFLVLAGGALGIVRSLRRRARS